MINCPKCNNEIANNSSTCPYCGITKNIIDEMLSTNKLVEQGKIEKQKNKKKIIVIEIGLLFIISIIYIQLFIPRILEYSRMQRRQKQIEACEEDYNGKWDYTKEECIIDGIGSFEME